jgi:hypothetical protein
MERLCRSDAHSPIRGTVIEGQDAEMLNDVEFYLPAQRWI